MTQMSGLLEHLWQTTLVFGVLFVVGVWMRNAPARLLNLLCWAALAKLFLSLDGSRRVRGAVDRATRPGALDALYEPETASAGLAAFVAPVRLVVHGGGSWADALGSPRALGPALACGRGLHRHRVDPSERPAAPPHGSDNECPGDPPEPPGPTTAGRRSPADRVTLVEGREMPRVSGSAAPAHPSPAGTGRGPRPGRASGAADPRGRAPATTGPVALAARSSRGALLLLLSAAVAPAAPVADHDGDGLRRAGAGGGHPARDLRPRTGAHDRSLPRVARGVARGGRTFRFAVAQTAPTHRRSLEVRSHDQTSNAH